MTHFSFDMVWLQALSQSIPMKNEILVVAGTSVLAGFNIIEVLTEYHLGLI